jgi:hypothetical protein
MGRAGGALGGGEQCEAVADPCRSVAAAFAPRPDAKRGAATAAGAGGGGTPEGAAVVDVAYSALLDAAAVVLASGHCALLRQAAGATPPRTPTGGVGNAHGGGAWVLGLECVRWLGSGDDATTAAFAPTARLLAVRASSECREACALGVPFHTVSPNVSLRALTHLMHH